MRKTWSWLIVAMMILTSLSVAVAEDNPYEDFYKITWTTYVNSPIAEDAVLIKAVEEKFNVDIDMLNIEDNNFLEVLNTRIAGGDIPDVIRLKDPSQMLNYVDQGVIGELPMDIVREHLPYVVGLLDNFEDGSYWGMGNVDGAQYAIPAIAGGNIFHLPIIYNMDWMNAVGITEIPTTLEDLETLLYAFANDDPDGNGTKDTYGVSSDGLRLLYGAYGINPGACDGRTDHSFFQLIDDEVVWAASTPQYKEALKVANKWYQDGIIDPEFITGENTGGYWAISHAFVNGRIGMTVRGNFYHWVMPGMYEDYNEHGELVPISSETCGNVAKEIIAINPDAEIAYGEVVEGPYGSGVKSWNMLAQFYVFSPSATEDEGKFTRIMDIMNFMEQQYITEHNETRQEVAEFMYGPEGELWFWQDKENGILGTTEKYRELYPEFDAVDNFGPTQWGPSVPERQVDKRSQFGYSLGYDKGGISNLIQFSLPSMAEYQANITMMKDNAMIEFITGKRDIDADWDAYINELNQAGLQEMLDEVTEWYWGSQK